MAHSIASVPELVKKTLSAKVLSTSDLANFSWFSTLYRLEVCHKFLACSIKTLTNFSLQWPKMFTAIPEVQSKNLRPSLEYSHIPSPFLKETFFRLYVANT